MKLIDDTIKLNEACEVLKKEKIIAIDTEFIREKTYYPIPCLIQVGYENGTFIIDPLVKDMDMTAFFEILQSPKILKIFHSGRQDIEILYNLSGQIPNPIFDTQIAAEVCGLGEYISYENLVKTYCKITLDKSCRLTNWQRRPLTSEQLEYASGDVTHLITCYKCIMKNLKENKREDWFIDDIKDLSDISHYKIDPEKVWQKIKHNSHSIAFLNALKALATWREMKAMKTNVSRQTIIKDEFLINIATAFPKTLEELATVRGIRADMAKGKQAKEIIEILSNLTEDKWDKTLNKEESCTEINLTTREQSLCEVLRLLLKIQSNETGVVARLITSEKNLRAYIKYGREDNPILKGWRYEIFGKLAEDFKNGKKGIIYDNKHHRIVIKDIS